MGIVAFLARLVLAALLARSKRRSLPITMPLVKAGPSFFAIATPERPSLCNSFNLAIRFSVQSTMTLHSSGLFGP